MEDDQEKRPESLLPYEAWTEMALRQVVVEALAHVAAVGLPGGHHFYITFQTDHPGVVIPPRLKTKYPQEMTIVLQHQFWDLKVDREAGLITVGLSFGGVPATLAIPLDAIIGFADPYVQYGLRFRPVEHEAVAEISGTIGPATEAPEESAQPVEDKPQDDQQVVSLDAFRRRPPPKE